MLHTRAANIRFDRYCSNFLKIGVELKAKVSQKEKNSKTTSTPKSSSMWTIHGLSMADASVSLNNCLVYYHTAQACSCWTEFSPFMLENTVYTRIL